MGYQQQFQDVTKKKQIQINQMLEKQKQEKQENSPQNLKLKKKVEKKPIMVLQENKKTKQNLATQQVTINEVKQNFKNKKIQNIDNAKQRIASGTQNILTVKPQTVKSQTTKPQTAKPVKPLTAKPLSKSTVKPQIKSTVKPQTVKPLTKSIVKPQTQEKKIQQNQIKEENIRSVTESSIIEPTQKDLKDKIDQLSQPIILLLGCPGVGKTTLMSKLFPKQQIEEFKLFYHKQLNCNIVDTRGFDFTTSVDSREEQIGLFQKFFNDYPNQISQLFIIVNFERTDLMKSKIKEVYSYFLKFSNKITIVITQFHLSEDKSEDKQHLEKHLSYYKAKKIIFTGDDTNEQQLLKEFQEVKSNNTFNFPVDLKDTIFENVNEQMGQIFIQLQKQFIKQ